MSYKGYPYTIVFTDPSLPGKDRFVVEQNTSDGPLLPTLNTPDSSATEIHTSLVLPGMGLAQYGERIDQDLVHLLENFAGRTPPVQPTVGQSWYDWSSKEMKVWNGTVWATNADGIVAAAAEYNMLAMWLNDMGSLATIATPTTISPANGAIAVAPDVSLQGSAYVSRYKALQAAVQFQAGTDANLSSITHDVTRYGPVDNGQFLKMLTANATYYWRLRYQDDQGAWSSWSNVASFSVEKASINTPSVVAPIGANISITTRLVGSPLSIKNGSDVLIGADWEIWSGPNGTGQLYHSFTSSTTSYQIAEGQLDFWIDYYVRVRYRGVALGTSAWSNSVAFKTAAVPAGTISSYFCLGYNYMAVTADGKGGTTNVVVEANSESHCGFVPAIPAGTEISTYCSGFDYVASVADGNYGTYEVVREYKSVAHCGYIVPTTRIEFKEPGTFTVTVPANVTVMAAYVLAGSGGGGGGGGAGEYNWTPSASGGGGGGGGAGQLISTVISVVPGQQLIVTVGGLGVGGAAGDGYWITGSNERRIGLDGKAGADGGDSAISPIGVVAVGGKGGQGGTGGLADLPWSVSAGGTSGGGWPTGKPGQFNHMVGVFTLGVPYDAIQRNLAAGQGGVGGVGENTGGAGGDGGDWGNPGWGKYSPTYIGSPGRNGQVGYVELVFGKNTPPDNTALPYTGPEVATPWPYHV